MAERAMIDQLVSTGMTEADASAAINAVFAAVAPVLKRSRAVTIPGVCQLRAPERPAWTPGYKGKRAHVQRKVEGHHYAVLERGEPYETRGPACREPITDGMLLARTERTS